jgi:poly(A) polymerase
VTVLAALLAGLTEEQPVLPLDLAGTLAATPTLARLDALVAIETGQLFEWDAERRLAALLPDDRLSVTRIATGLGAPAALAERLAAAVPDARVRIVSWMSPREIRRAIYRIGAQAFRDRVLLAWAGSDRSSTAAQWRMLMVYPETWTPPGFPITDSEIRAAGVAPGPLFDQVRREVEDWWLDLDFTDDKMAAVERLKAVVQGLVY